MKLSWLRFDVPYSANIKNMRITIAFEENSVPVSHALLTNDLRAGMKEADEFCHTRKIRSTSESTMVAPHDERHGFAWEVKEQADARNWKFARHVPADFDYPAAWPMTNEGFATGSPNESWDEDTLFSFAKEKNSAAHEYYTSGMDLLKAMGALRETLQVVWHHKGWLHPVSLYTLRNYCYVVNGTGNSDNQLDALRHMRRLLWWFENSPDAVREPEWQEFLPQFAQLAEQLGGGDLAGKLNARAV